MAGSDIASPSASCLSVISSCSESRKSDFICVNESPTSPSTRNMSGDAVRLIMVRQPAEEVGQLLRSRNCCLHACK